MEGVYSATCVRGGDYWALHIAELPSAFTQAANLEQIPFMAADVVEQLGGRTVDRLRLIGPAIAETVRRDPPATAGAELDRALRVGFIDPAGDDLTAEIQRHGRWDWRLDGDNVICERATRTDVVDSR